MGVRAILASVLCATAALCTPASAVARAYAPHDGRAYHGVSDTGSVADFKTFTQQVGAHPALLQDFFHWRVPLTTGALYRWGATDTRGVLSLSTQTGDGVEMITPRQIARGKDDRYMTRMAGNIADTGQTVYIRLMAEMNGHWNAYSAYNADGSPRHHGHSARWYRLAWRRFTLIMRGGPRDRINHELLRMGLPRILRAKSQDDPVYEGGPDGIPLPIPEQMPQPRVAMMWVPQSFGSPNIAGNQPKDYWPGGKYVDWVGLDVYSKFAGAFNEDVAFFNKWDKWPFVIGEYSPWDNDFGGTFTGNLFRWAEAHDRVKMMLYYRGVDPSNNYNVQYYPGARKALRNHLAEPHWAEFAPGVRGLSDPPEPRLSSPLQPRLFPQP
jgi:hypothetical protein